MQESRISVNGVPEIASALRKLSFGMKEKCIKTAVNKAATIVLNAIRSETPVSRSAHKGRGMVFQPGSLRASVWKKVIVSRESDDVVAFVGPHRKQGSSVYYGHFVISGRRRGNKYAKANNFVKRGIDKSKEQALNVMKTTILEKIYQLGLS